MVVVRGTGSPRLHLHICLLLLGLPEAGGSAQGADPQSHLSPRKIPPRFFSASSQAIIPYLGFCVFSVQFSRCTMFGPECGR